MGRTGETPRRRQKNGTRGGNDAIEAVLEARFRSRRPHGEVVLQVGRAHEEHVDTVDPRDAGGLVDGVERLDLRDQQRCGPAVERPEAVVVGPHRPRHAALPARRIRGRPHELLGLHDLIDVRHHHPVRAMVEHAGDEIGPIR